jgi:hypothetical protein
MKELISNDPRDLRYNYLEMQRKESNRTSLISLLEALMFGVTLAVMLIALVSLVTGSSLFCPGSGSCSEVVLDARSSTVATVSLGVSACLLTTLVLLRTFLSVTIDKQNLVYSLAVCLVLSQFSGYVFVIRVLNTAFQFGALCVLGCTAVAMCVAATGRQGWARSARFAFVSSLLACGAMYFGTYSLKAVPRRLNAVALNEISAESLVVPGERRINGNRRTHLVLFTDFNCSGANEVLTMALEAATDPNATFGLSVRHALMSPDPTALWLAVVVESAVSSHDKVGTIRRASSGHARLLDPLGTLGESQNDWTLSARVAQGIRYVASDVGLSDRLGLTGVPVAILVTPDGKKVVLTSGHLMEILKHRVHREGVCA